MNNALKNELVKSRQISDIEKDLVAVRREQKTVADKMDSLTAPLRPQLHSLQSKEQALLAEHELALVRSWGFIVEVYREESEDQDSINILVGENFRPDLKMLFYPPYRDRGFCRRVLSCGVEGLLKYYLDWHHLYYTNLSRNGIYNHVEMSIGSRMPKQNSVDLIVKGVSELLPFLATDEKGNIVFHLKGDDTSRSYGEHNYEEYSLRYLRINAKTHETELFVQRYIRYTIKSRCYAAEHAEKRLLATGDIRTAMEYLVTVRSFNRDEFREMFSHAVSIIPE